MIKTFHNKTWIIYDGQCGRPLNSSSYLHYMRKRKNIHKHCARCNVIFSNELFVEPQMMILYARFHIFWFCIKFSETQNHMKQILYKIPADVIVRGYFKSGLVVRIYLYCRCLWKYVLVLALTVWLLYICDMYIGKIDELLITLGVHNKANT